VNDLARHYYGYSASSACLLLIKESKTLGDVTVSVCENRKFDSRGVTPLSKRMRVVVGRDAQNLDILAAILSQVALVRGEPLQSKIRAAPVEEHQEDRTATNRVVEANGPW
jgi:hypothetical protein